MANNKTDKIKEVIDQVPEQVLKEKSKKDKISEAVDIIKQEYGIEVEPVKNVKFKIEKAINFFNDNYEFRYNVINTDIEYRCVGEKLWKYYDERDLHDLRINLKLNNISVSDADINSIVKGSRVCRDFNPFMDYFNRIGKCDSMYEYNGKGNYKTFKSVKSGRDYIKEFCSQVYLVNENENRSYFVEGFRKWFTALVVSLVNDEPSMYTINQTCLVLVGSQGKYKTTWLKSIVPVDLQLKYFYGSNFQIHNKDHEKFLAYKILINFDEMAAYNKTDIESIKSAISRDQIVLRLPWAKADIHLKRRASFAATQNNVQFLKDETGSRRWIVIEVENISLNPDFEINKMYAQGLQHYKDGLQYWFDAEDIQQQEKKNERFQLRTFEYELMQKFFEIPAENSTSEFIRYYTATDIVTKLAKDNHINVNNTVISNVGKALTALGFEKKSKRIDGKGPRDYWYVEEVLTPNSQPKINKDDEIF